MLSKNTIIIYPAYIVSDTQNKELNFSLPSLPPVTATVPEGKSINQSINKINHFPQFIYLSICLPSCLSACLSTCCISFYLSICSVYLPACLPLFLSVCVSVCVFVFLSSLQQSCGCKSEKVQGQAARS